jgi:hypothetical protein
MGNPLRNVSRRDVLRATAVTGAALGLNWVGNAQPIGAAAAPARGEVGADFITAETQTAIDRGLAHLAQAQGADGSFGDRGGGTVSGITGLCGLALLGAGNQPGRGKYGKHVSRTVDYVLSLGGGREDGYLTTGFGGFGLQPSAMYSHGFAGLFLAEVCGMIPDAARQKRVREKLERATDFAVRAQGRDGGWRYDPHPTDSDVSVTVAIMMALRAARNAGVFVRKTTIRRGAEFIRLCQANEGGFSYFKRQGYAAFARSAAAVVGLYSASIPEDEEVNARAIDRGLGYLRQYVPTRQFTQREVPANHYYYGQYYAALAMWSAGGDYWRAWFPAIRDELLNRARVNGGSWTDAIHGSAYATAMSLIILQLPNNYLPILQK